MAVKQQTGGAYAPQPLPPPPPPQVNLATTDASGHDSGKFQGTRVAVSAPSTLPPPCL